MNADRKEAVSNARGSLRDENAAWERGRLAGLEEARKACSIRAALYRSVRADTGAAACDDCLGDIEALAARARETDKNKADVGSSLPSSAKDGSSVQAGATEAREDGTPASFGRSRDAAGSIPPTSAPTQSAQEAGALMSEFDVAAHELCGWARSICKAAKKNGYRIDAMGLGLLEEACDDFDKARLVRRAAPSEPRQTMQAGTEEVIAKIKKAEDVVSGLCEGSIKWRMSVPAQPDRDPDLVIGDALGSARRLLALTAPQREREADGCPRCSKHSDKVLARISGMWDTGAEALGLRLHVDLGSLPVEERSAKADAIQAHFREMNRLTDVGFKIEQSAPPPSPTWPPSEEYARNLCVAIHVVDGTARRAAENVVKSSDVHNMMLALCEVGPPAAQPSSRDDVIEECALAIEAAFRNAPNDRAGGYRQNEISHGCVEAMRVVRSLKSSIQPPAAQPSASREFVERSIVVRDHLHSLSYSDCDGPTRARIQADIKALDTALAAMSRHPDTLRRLTLAASKTTVDSRNTEENLREHAEALREARAAIGLVDADGPFAAMSRAEGTGTDYTRGWNDAVEHAASMYVWTDGSLGDDRERRTWRNIHMDILALKRPAAAPGTQAREDGTVCGRCLGMGVEPVFDVGAPKGVPCRACRPLAAPTQSNKAEPPSAVVTEERVREIAQRLVNDSLSETIERLSALERREGQGEAREATCNACSGSGSIVTSAAPPTIGTCVSPCWLCQGRGVIRSILNVTSKLPAIAPAESAKANAPSPTDDDEGYTFVRHDEDDNHGIRRPDGSEFARATSLRSTKAIVAELNKLHRHAERARGDIRREADTMRSVLKLIRNRVVLHSDYERDIDACVAAYDRALSPHPEARKEAGS